MHCVCFVYRLQWCPLYLQLITHSHPPLLDLTHSIQSTVIAPNFAPAPLLDLTHSIQTINCHSTQFPPPQTHTKTTVELHVHTSCVTGTHTKQVSDKSSVPDCSMIYTDVQTVIAGLNSEYSAVGTKSWTRLEIPIYWVRNPRQAVQISFYLVWSVVPLRNQWQTNEGK